MREKEFSEHFAQMQTRIAADDVKALSRPQTAADFKIELPADFKTPPGVEFKFNDADPLLAQAKDWAHRHGLNQDAFKEALGLFAGSQVTTVQQVNTARNAEVAKLGVTGPARIDALSTFFKGFLGDSEGVQFMSRMFTASDIQMAEKLVTKVTSQGGAAFRGTGREPPPQSGRVTEDQFAKMSAAQRLDYARTHDQSQFQNKH